MNPVGNPHVVDAAAGRGEALLKADIAECGERFEELEPVRARPSIWVEKLIRRVIIVPGRLINVVV